MSTLTTPVAALIAPVTGILASGSTAGGTPALVSTTVTGVGVLIGGVVGSITTTGLSGTTSSLSVRR